MDLSATHRAPHALPKQDVPEEFDRVASGYDRLCALNPGYQKHLEWSARRLTVPEGGRALDLCCGTGLSTRALLRAHPTAQIIGLDASHGMLDFASRKPELAGVTWLQGDAMDPRMGGAEGPFDAILMAYGIRNVPDPDTCLQRLHALLRPGGMICLHEYSVADSWRSRVTWNLVTWSVVIPLGVLVTHSSTIFRYLRRSVLEFDGATRLQERMRQAGFVDVHTEPMDGWQRGIVHSFLGRRAP